MGCSGSKGTQATSTNGGDVGYQKSVNNDGQDPEFLPGQICAPKVTFSIVEASEIKSQSSEDNSDTKISHNEREITPLAGSHHPTKQETVDSSRNTEDAVDGGARAQNRMSGSKKTVFKHAVTNRNSTGNPKIIEPSSADLDSDKPAEKEQAVEL